MITRIVSNKRQSNYLIRSNWHNFGQGADPLMHLTVSVYEERYVNGEWNGLRRKTATLHVYGVWSNEDNRMVRYP